MSSSSKTKIKKPARKPKNPTKNSDAELFEDNPDEEELSEYSDMENDLNNDDTNIVVDEIPEGQPTIDDDDEEEEDLDDEKVVVDSTLEDLDDDDDDDESDEDYIPEIAKQANRSNLLQNTREVRIIKLTKKEDFITPNILTRFEHAAMICNRAAHLEMGAPSFVDTSDQTDELGITMKEFKAGKIPFMVSRQVGNKVEWHSGSEMQLNAHIQNVLKDV
jgi:DNA-directed RNA polymerase I, II, and III subunit RPABC2